MATGDPVGTKWYIGPITAAANISAYAALTYVEVKDIESVPDLGAASNPVNWTPLNTGVQQTDKGSVNPGGGDLMCFMNNTDPGQLAMLAARNSRFGYAMKCVVPDAANASAPNSTFYFHAKVLASPMTSVQGDSKPRRKFTISLDKIPLDALTT